MASTQIKTQSKSSNNIEFKSIVRATAIAALAAVAGNIVILAIAALLLGVPFNGQIVNVVSITASTLITTVVAGGVYALLLRSTRQPDRVFTIVGVIVFLLSLSGPIMGLLGQMPGTSVSWQLAVAMIAMHIWSSAVIVWTLITQTRRTS